MHYSEGLNTKPARGFSSTMLVFNRNELLGSEGMPFVFDRVRSIIDSQESAITSH
ncbi:hypothetical protein EDC26_108101 [Paralcaligenes ureilyticus]|uniref:Uncharacterized protein n=1 Tax=Paralcaligenes ureilyticus TaxID=627131 RepID=A0A4R3M572_9BURK|nr:hypothetical protein EDC26_108101 [Paralcaligenes ureilyticus]